MFPVAFRLRNFFFFFFLFVLRKNITQEIRKMFCPLFIIIIITRDLNLEMINKIRIQNIPLTLNDFEN